jgi:hypothetical protein
MDPALSAYFKTPEQKYYALPFYDAFFGIYYDVDLFESKGFYLKRDATAEGVDLNNSTAVMSLFLGPNSTAERSAGPDGDQSAADDNGLPATYADFYALMKRMKLSGVKPFIWTGTYLVYVQRFMDALWADGAGAEQFALNFTLSGKAENLIEVAGNGTVTPYQGTGEADITKANGALLQKSKAKYDALNFARAIVSDNGNFSDLSFSGSLSHLGAQEQYLYGRYSDSMDTIGMLIEGSWWEMEARGVFSDMARDDESASRLNRRIGFLPLPKATPADVDGSRTVLSMNDSVCFVNKKSTGASLDAAKLFLQYCHTERR